MDNTQMSGRTLEKEVFIKASPERVFQALTEKEELESWFVREAEVDLRPGGAISFDWNRAKGVYNFGKIQVLEAPHRLSYTWQAMEPAPTPITFELTAQNDGTLLHLSHSGIGEGEDWHRYYELRDNGWNIHLEHLVSWLETGTCPSPGPIKRPS